MEKERKDKGNKSEKRPAAESGNIATIGGEFSRERKRSFPEEEVTALVGRAPEIQCRKCKYRSGEVESGCRGGSFPARRQLNSRIPLS